MKSLYQILLSIIILLGLISCNRHISETDNKPDVTKMQDLVVPVNFSWETKQETEIIINIEGTKSYEPKHKITIFKDNPDNNGKMLLAGSVSPGNAFTEKISLPTYIEELFVVCESPFGGKQTERLNVTSGIVSHTFTTFKNIIVPATGHLKSTNDGPDCNEGCDEIISGGGTVNINDGKTYCVLESFNGKINFQNWNGGGTLRVCGSAVITNDQYLESNSHIVVAEGGYLSTSKNIQLQGGTITIYQSADVELDDIELGNDSPFTIYENTVVEVKKFDGWGTNSPIINWGSLTVKKNSNHASNIENYGTTHYKEKLELNAANLYNSGELNIDKDFQAYGSGAEIYNDGTITADENFEYGSNITFSNNGTILVEKNFRIYDNAILVNNGSIEVSDNCEISTNGDFTNNCQFICEKSIDFSGGIKIVLNTGYLKAGKEINFWNNKSVDIFDNCMITCEDMDMQCDMNGEGGLSSVIVLDKLNVWDSSDKFGGAIEVATTSGELNSGGDENFTNGAYYTSIDEAVNYLPVTMCNPDGFGTPSVVDMDFDGVPDEIDDFPTDPERAFTSYFPDNQQVATVAFEDLWPSKGDYDFNDLVVAFYGSEVTNANDDLVDINFSFIVKAVGASLDNGFAFQLESITPDMVASVTGMVLEKGYANIAGNGLEEGQSKAVVIVTESVNDIIHRAEGSFFNTNPENPQGTSDTVNITITFNEPINRQLFGLEVFNPFIIKNQDRTVEIHLPDNPPTDLMNTDLFGSFDDASNPVAGDYYVTTTNLPWGLFLLEPFDYPKEESQIINAYNYFGTWAESGGTLYDDWYLNYSGYRNAADIYQ